LPRCPLRIADCVPVAPNPNPIPSLTPNLKLSQATEGNMAKGSFEARLVELLGVWHRFV
jgi:hypothetical protein